MPYAATRVRPPGVWRCLAGSDPDRSGSDPRWQAQVVVVALDDVAAVEVAAAVRS
jgi:hypothetical protein